MKVIAVSIAFAVLASGCGLWPGQDDELGDILLEDRLPGFEVLGPPTSGPMDLQTTADTTVADSGRLRTQLARTGFQRASSRVWSADDGFVVALVLEFLTEQRARHLVEFQATEHERKRGAVHFEPPDIPGGAAFLFNAQRRTGGQLFCQNVWFSHGRFAFETRTCRDRPGSPDLAVRMAKRQLERVRTALETGEVR